ncbi:MAG: hypothetical protein GY715_04855 [Planctomycetes bacterium]|nr:hypothetical protein [Planctomycetota bacterium]
MYGILGFPGASQPVAPFVPPFLATVGIIMLVVALRDLKYAVQDARSFRDSKDIQVFATVSTPTALATISGFGAARIEFQLDLETVANSATAMFAAYLVASDRADLFYMGYQPLAPKERPRSFRVYWNCPEPFTADYFELDVRDLGEWCRTLVVCALTNSDHSEPMSGEIRVFGTRSPVTISLQQDALGRVT